METATPRFVVAGLSGDSGKTVVALSLAAHLRRQGFRLSAFKKGPDYIDAAWLTAVSGAECRNLDTWMVDSEQVKRRFIRHSSSTDLAIIEGNRGLFDGRGADGAHSTAELAKLLGAPVILVVDATKTTRTVAAMVRGCLDFDPDLKIAGVIVNRLAGARHEKTVVEALRKYCGTPVFGAIPKLKGAAGVIPGRHLGLVTPAEHGFGSDLESRLAETGEKYLDSGAIVAVAGRAERLEARGELAVPAGPKVARVGYFRDSVFTFYYPENLEALETEGAELVPVSSLEDSALPDVDALYIGGGFPETHAEKLARNESMLTSVRKNAERGMPVYAECGGLIYLSKSLAYEGRIHRMAGVVPLELMICVMPVGHGYVTLEVDRANPFFETGARINGHEFHYSGPASEDFVGTSCMRVEIGTGIGKKRDGLLQRNVVACYTHIHADGVKNWASRLVASAKAYSADKAKA